MVGTAIQDTATLTGGFHPTGTVTFILYSDPGTCQVPVFSPPAATLGTNGTATSASYTPTAPGMYQWVASYSGDGNNNAVTGSCSDTTERVTVAPSSSTPPVTPRLGNIGNGNSGFADLGNGNQGNDNNGDGNQGNNNNGDGNQGFDDPQDE